MLIYGMLITVVGMGAVYAFLFLLMGTVQLTSFLVQKTDKKADLNEVAAAIAIVLKNGEK